jgi:hypothetical protein
MCIVLFRPKEKKKREATERRRESRFIENGDHQARKQLKIEAIQSLVMFNLTFVLSLNIMMS